MDISAHKIFNFFINIFRNKNPQSIPRIVKIRNFIPEGCKFEISTPVEIYRVEKYGGEEEFTSLIIKEISKEDVLYDIGSCVGMVAVHSALKGCRVVAFEPDPNYRVRLETNLGLNNLNNVQIVKWAVSGKAGKVVLYTDGVEGYSPSLCKIGNRGQITVQSDTIDNALNRNEIPYPNVIKMDIEGAEYMALHGLKNLLSSPSGPRKIFIEIHPKFLKELGSSSEDVINLLETFQYKQDYYVLRQDQIHCIFKKSI